MTKPPTIVNSLIINILSEVGGSLLRLKMVMYVLGERFVEL